MKISEQVAALEAEVERLKKARDVLRTEAERCAKGWDTCGAENRALREKLRVTEELFESLGDANELAVENEKLKEKLEAERGRAHDHYRDSVEQGCLRFAAQERVSALAVENEKLQATVVDQANEITKLRADTKNLGAMLDDCDSDRIDALDDYEKLRDASPPKDEVAWLVEWKDGNTKYWVPDGWSYLPDHAIRFARKQDAERVINTLPGRKQMTLAAVDHMWCAPRAPESTEDKS